MAYRPSTFLIAALPFAVAVASCGSKTGLFGPESTGGTVPPPLPEAGVVDSGVRDTGVDGPVPCVPGRFEFVVATAQLMFVVDRSGSMAMTLDGREDPRPGEQTRWEILRDGLSQTLTGFDQQIAMGAKFFPSARFNPQLSCVVDPGIDFAPRLGNAASILGVFQRTQPRGGTPTADALRIAAEHVSKTRAVARTLVLATDGAPNCNFEHPGAPCVCTSNVAIDCASGDVTLCLDDANTVATIRDIAENQKVPVYVIGLGTFDRVEYRQALDAMAVAGGRSKPSSPRYYSAETPGELNIALTSIRDSVGSCTFLTPSAPTNPDDIRVEIDGVAIPRDTTRAEGWDWVDQAYGTLALFGRACERAGRARVSGVVRCE